MTIRAALACGALALATPRIAVADEDRRAGAGPATKASATEESGATRARPSSSERALRGVPQAPLPAYQPGAPDRAATELAEDANLEPTTERSGFLIGVAAGSALQLGNVASSSGFGGSFELRVGTSAGRDLQLMAVLASTSYLKENLDGDPKLNQNLVLAVAPQLYLREGWWIRVGAGPAVFTRGARQATAPDDRFAGLGLIAASGVDVLRRGRFRLSVELAAALARYPDQPDEDGGQVGSSALQLGGTFY